MAQETIDDDKQLSSLRTMLKEFDSDNLGVISIQTIQVAMRQAGYNVTLQEVERLVSEMDQVCKWEEEEVRGTTCLISIDQFLSALIDLRELQSSDRWMGIVHAVFQKLDRHGNGKLRL